MLLDIADDPADCPLGGVHGRRTFRDRVRNGVRHAEAASVLEVRLFRMYRKRWQGNDRWSTDPRRMLPCGFMWVGRERSRLGGLRVMGVNCFSLVRDRRRASTS